MIFFLSIIIFRYLDQYCKGSFDNRIFDNIIE